MLNSTGVPLREVLALARLMPALRELHICCNCESQTYSLIVLNMSVVFFCTTFIYKYSLILSSCLCFLSMSCPLVSPSIFSHSVFLFCPDIYVLGQVFWLFRLGPHSLFRFQWVIQLLSFVS